MLLTNRSVQITQASTWQVSADAIIYLVLLIKVILTTEARSRNCDKYIAP